MKYAVPLAARELVLRTAAPFVVPDPHGVDLPGGGRGYVVHSTYFDSPDLQEYTSRLCDYKVRRRVRVRTYGAPGDKAPVFLELKRKLDSQVIKQRAKVGNADTWATLGDAPWAWYAEHGAGESQYVATRFTGVIDKYRLGPVSSVHYERETYVDPRPEYPKIRLTIDREITATVRPTSNNLYPEPEIALIPSDWMILELKFDGAEPSWMRQICRELRLSAESVSKFGLSVALGLRADHPREGRRLTPRSIRRFQERA